MWDSLKPDWNVTRIMWLGSERKKLNLSQIESKNTESNRIRNHELKQMENRKLIQVRNGDSDLIGNGESNQVKKNGHRRTANANDGASIGYLMALYAMAECSRKSWYWWSADTIGVDIVLSRAVSGQYSV